MIEDATKKNNDALFNLSKKFEVPDIIGLNFCKFDCFQSFIEVSKSFNNILLFVYVFIYLLYSIFTNKLKN